MTDSQKKDDTPVYDETLHEHVETENSEEAKIWLKDLDSATGKKPPRTSNG